MSTKTLTGRRALRAIKPTDVEPHIEVRIKRAPEYDALNQVVGAGYSMDYRDDYRNWNRGDHNVNKAWALNYCINNWGYPDEVKRTSVPVSAEDIWL